MKTALSKAERMRRAERWQTFKFLTVYALPIAVVLLIAQLISAALK